VLVREHQDLRALFARVRDREADRAEAWRDAVTPITTHVAVERSCLYPLVKRRRLDLGPLAHDLRHDYKHMEHLLVLTERRKINSPDTPELVTDLLDVFESHQERCETILLPAPRDRLSQDELDELGAKMRGAENVILSYPHPHLLALGPVYRGTTRLASTWDRVRDRTPQP
jgi:hypothetical protein